MNPSLGTTCGQPPPAATPRREGKADLVKNCHTCGRSQTLTACDASHCFGEGLPDPGREQSGCDLACASCAHTGATPSFAFVDVTNRCNMDCPICCDNVPGMGFTFEPPMDYFERLFGRLAELEPRPTVVLFGGEPTMRTDLIDIIALSRRHGLKTHVTTNGLKLADPDYCDRLLATRATILLSYDGAQPETYVSLRGTARSLPLKQKAIENIARSRNLRPGRLCLVTCLARGVNDRQIPELLEFYHSKRHFLSTVHFMPVAHTPEHGVTGSDAERITAEDVEELIDRAFPDDRVDFIPAGAIARFAKLSSLFESAGLPFQGAHPNCESISLLVSDGDRYQPVSHYLRCRLTELAYDMMELAKRLRGASMHKARLGAGLLRLLARRVRFGRLLKGRGPLKLWNALALLARLATGGSGREALAAHTNVQGTLLLLIAVPFEDDDIMETDRLERFPNVHVYIDPASDELRFVPVCAWRLFNKPVLSAIADALPADSQQLLRHAGAAMGGTWRIRDLCRARTSSSCQYSP